MRLELDHIIVCVADLSSATRLFEERFGVTTVGGGKHPGHGTENSIIPLGPNYIELLTVSDPIEAASSPFGRWAVEQSHGADAKAVCVRTDDLDSVCQRLGLSATVMSRETPDGDRLEWRIAGLEEALPQVMPFFIQWDMAEELHPGRALATPAARESRLTSVAILGDHVDDLRLWAPEPGGLSYLLAPYREITYHLATAAKAL